LTSLPGNNNDGSNYARRRREPSTANTLFAGRMDCAYCRGNQKHEDCTRVTSRKERLELLRKFNRCYNCINKGQGILKDERVKRVRVLFDSGSQKSFVTSRAMNDAKLHVVRNEWLEVSTFGCATKEGKMREVVDFDINSIKGNNSARLEDLVVSHICQVRN
jgi:hypothetical protein